MRRGQSVPCTVTDTTAHHDPSAVAGDVVGRRAAIVDAVRVPGGDGRAGSTAGPATSALRRGCLLPRCSTDPGPPPYLDAAGLSCLSSALLFRVPQAKAMLLLREVLRDAHSKHSGKPGGLTAQVRRGGVARGGAGRVVG